MPKWILNHDYRVWKYSETPTNSEFTIIQTSVSLWLDEFCKYWPRMQQNNRYVLRGVKHIRGTPSKICSFFFKCVSNNTKYVDFLKCARTWYLFYNLWQIYFVICSLSFKIKLCWLKIQVKLHSVTPSEHISRSSSIIRTFTDLYKGLLPISLN
jgi:hypothetical protein